MGKLMMTAAAVLVVGNVFALQGWLLKGTGSMNNTANWSAKVVPTTDQTSANSAWCFWYAHTDPTTLTLDSDLVTDRVVIDQDKSGADVTFDFGTDRTLMFKGTTGIGIRIHRANDVKFRLTSGTIRVDSDTADNNVLYFPSGTNNDTTQKPGARNLFLIDSPSSKLYVPTFDLTYGEDNSLVVTNGGYLSSDLVFAHANSARNRVILSGTGTTFANQNASGTVTAGDHSGAADNVFEVTDGATISNFKTLKIGGLRTTFAVRGANTALKTTGSRSTFGCSAGGGNRLEITDGASFTLGGSDGRFWMGTTGSTPSNVVWVSGVGSKFIAESTSNHVIANGSGSDGNRVVIRDGATAQIAGSTRIGGGTGNGNVVRVESGAKATFGNVYPGHGENGANSGNAFEIVGTGTEVETTGEVRLGLYAASTGNRMTVGDGATLKVDGDVTIGDGGGGNAAVVSGGALFWPQKGVVVGRGSSGNVLTVRGGVVSNLTADADFKIGSGASGNALVVDGGAVKWHWNFYTGNNSATSPGGNAIAVVNGGTIDVESTFYLFGPDNALAVTNGILSANKIQLPHTNDGDASPTIVLAGTNCAIRSATTLQIRRGAKILFAPTGKGYVAPALQADDLQLIDGATPAKVAFDLSGLDIEPGESIVLAEGGTQLQVQHNVLASAKAAVPKGYSVRVSGNQLLLRKNGGFCLLFK